MTDNIQKKDRKEYFKAYYLANKPTPEERAIMREAYREQRKKLNATSRAILKAKKINGQLVAQSEYQTLILR